MREAEKSTKQLAHEVAVLRQRIAHLEASEAQHRHAEAQFRGVAAGIDSHFRTSAVRIRTVGVSAAWLVQRQHKETQDRGPGESSL